MENLHIEFEQHRAFMELITPEVKEHMEGLAAAYEELTYGGLLAAELVQDTITKMYGMAYPAPGDKTKTGEPVQPQVLTNLLHLSSRVMANHYRDYVRVGTGQDLDMNLVGMPPGWNEAPPAFLTESPPQERAETQMDVQWALTQLKPRDAKIAQWVLMEEVDQSEIATRLGLARETVCRRLPKIVEQLRKLLADYEPERPSDKTLREKSA